MFFSFLHSGSSISVISSVVDDRLSAHSLSFVNHSIQFIRPLRDISYRELNALNGIDNECLENIEENGVERVIKGKN